MAVDEHSFRALVRRLDTAQKPGYGVPPYTRYINRWLGRRLAAAAHMARLTPNAVTWLSMAASAVGIAFLVAFDPSIPVAIAVAAFLCLGYALDSADGQLARLRRAGGPAGEWLDHVADAARQPALHLAVVVFLYQHIDWRWAPLVAMVMLVFTTARFMGQILAEQLRARHSRVDEDAPRDHAAAARRAIIQLPSDTGVICLSFALIAWPGLFFGVYGALTLANVALALASFRRRHRELTSLPPQ